MNCYTAARHLIDSAHSGDPKRPDGRPAELVYADRMEAWLVRLEPTASELLRLAARCQHLERWTVPRSSYPQGRTGYLAWRKNLYGKQADRARELLLEAGVDEREADNVATWVSKIGLKANPNTQLLEDAACLVFLENEIGSFATQHADYPREKFLEIIRKTWRKMSPSARHSAKGVSISPGITELVNEALQDLDA